MSTCCRLRRLHGAAPARLRAVARVRSPSGDREPYVPEVIAGNTG